MNRFIDQSILLLYCLLFVRYTPEYVIAFLTAAAFSSLNYSFEDTLFPLMACPVYGLLSWLRPEFSLFLPLMAYSFPPLRWSGAFALLCSVTGLIRFWLHSRELPFLAFGCILGILLCIRKDTFESLHRNLQKTRDDDMELQLLLEEKNQSLRDRQNTEIYAATLQERNRIAREIHDNVGHLLTRSILVTGALKVLYTESDLTRTLTQLEDTLNQAMDSIRSSVHDLRDSSINLQDALNLLIRDYSFCPVTLQYEMSPDIPGEVKYCIIAITQEALNNISRHSSASKASISVLEHPAFYQLVIKDNGAFKPGSRIPEPSDVLPPASRGMGLSNMESRIKALNGTIHFQKKDGFRIYAAIPKEEKENYEFDID